MEKLENFLSKYIGPVANYMAQSNFFGALSEAFMRTTPITLGVAFLMIIGNLPIQGYEQLLIDMNLKVHFDAAIGATTGILSIIVTFNFAYIYAKRCNENALSSGLIAMVSFFLVMPQVIEGQDGVMVNAYNSLYTGGTGLFAAIIVAWISSVIYVALCRRHFTIKLPESVPTNVSESLAPSLIAMVILSMWFVIRVGLAFTPFENLFMIIFGILQQPLQALTSTPLSIIIIFTLANLLWFFGIHPNVVYGLVMPMIIANGATNITAYQQGETMPYLMMTVVLMAVGNGFGGQGGTYGFVFASFTAKSERYKSLRKLATIPAIFNINEPLIFGAPIMLNPTFFIPMVFSPLLMGCTAWLLTSILNVTYNPLIAMPWTTPTIVVAFLKGGVKFLIVMLAVAAVNFVLWYPFFKIADRQAYQEEQKLA